MPSLLEMTRPEPTSPVDPRFDAFLQAPIDEDQNDRLLSVLSALARLDLDPWHEAAELAAQSRSTAVARLASLIAAIPAPSATPRDSAAIASRLVALLPGARNSATPAAERQTRARGKGLSLAMLTFLVVVGLLGAWMISGWTSHLWPSSSPTGSEHSSPLGVDP